MNAIVPFQFEDQAVRVTDCDGQPWFVLADACALLGIRNPSDAASRLDETEKARLNLGSGSDATIVSLAGLLTLMLRCRGAMKPGTVPYRVRKWITAEVVPTIMRTGGYGTAAPVDPAKLDNHALRALLLGKVDDVIALQPKADALDRIANAEGSLCITDAAKALGVPPRRLFAWMEAHGWIYRRTNDGPWKATQAKIETRVIEAKVHRQVQRFGPDKLREQVLVTPKGLTHLAEKKAGV
ncbi:MAG: phage antirepressor KilAC domain-containing protein [Sphingomonas phyllosphaerae]|uniref:phage antirepressor n=1 Tax=Sphingomonas phyllosphaerae TaxID=257003 RepID=UPI002FF782C1